MILWKGTEIKNSWDS